jgi:hypothetical protein
MLKNDIISNGSNNTPSSFNINVIKAVKSFVSLQQSWNISGGTL